ncbi:YbaB/EbfC family nucleoid-associated protein [Actinomadura sp. HBU206391]|uniref:YbaB/EbfC family nucleoid-associated protein n=1 Tax=Actinomadura sp. HBU206391 TaxID=2731692 RepID=UPI00164FE3F9|nr:YbaB/EbfC family nucleoid-associated protein [Actinomadura sp. HBU206391]MBC6457982.1 YbaB/EbfC family nucleoid-associated protein [Actinomadura sp. HBU206391]
MVGDPEADDVPFEQKLRAARESLGSRTVSPAGDGAEAELRGEGEAVEGRVHAVALTGGRFDSLTLDPRVMRMDTAELADAISLALNAALDSVRAQASAQQIDMVPDAGTLMERLSEVQNAGLRQLDMMNRAINEALGGIRDRAYVSGDAGLHGMEHLFERAQQTVGALIAPSPGGEPPGGVGEAGEGTVRVKVSGSGRIEQIEFGPRAMRSASHELAAQVLIAANAGLEQARLEAAERMRGLGADMSQRVREVQDQSLEQLGGYVRSLNALMSSIQKR